MNRPARLVTAALTATAALLLTACGSGGGDDSSSDKIKGADGGGGKASASPSASDSPGGAGRPAITLPKEFQADFLSWTNSDPKLQAILNDGREELRSEYAAVIQADPNSEAVAFYNSDATLPSAHKWIKQFIDDGETLIGKVTVFKPQVHINDSGSGVLFYCVDERKASTKNRRTSKITTTPNTNEHVLQYRTRLERTAQGVWKLVSLNVVPGACG
ncbi:hypothetical protein [Streptomyces olivochromogenes]|uniref:hypothetical protein n=1 Tax=Streptomyces olivochromogenes TaxID=1963 RepID=UPI001F40509A|nr:hypothetical protein [Streptomyces olivochromogenes]MCF3129487.1 hypothetical protein [Streptomyces olivochromogenes]